MNKIFYILTRVALITAVMCFFAFVCVSQGCGPLSPRIKVDGTVNGHVDTSGNINIGLNLAALTNFFVTQCTAQLGPSATPAEVQACAASATNNFLSFINSVKAAR